MEHSGLMLQMQVVTEEHLAETCGGGSGSDGGDSGVEYSVSIRGN